MVTVGSTRKIKLSMNTFMKNYHFGSSYSPSTTHPSFTDYACKHSLKGRIPVNKRLRGALYKSAKSAAQIRSEICQCQKLHLCLRKYMYFQCWCISTPGLTQPCSQAPLLQNANIEAVQTYIIHIEHQMHSWLNNE